jgi:hypothetical protein
MEIEAQSLINAQKNIISDLQHQNIILQLTVQKMQVELDKNKQKEPTGE